MRQLPRFLIAALLPGLLLLNVHAQSGAIDPGQQEAARRAEQERAVALATANAEKMDQAAEAIITKLQAAVAANAPIKTYDTILQEIATVALNNSVLMRYGQVPRLEIARNFTTHWQDYLYAMTKGNFETAGQAVRQMLQEAATYPVIPRSDLMAMQDKLAAQAADADKAALAPLLAHLDTIVDTANKAADLDDFLTELATAQSREAQLHPNRNGAARPMQEIRQFMSRLQEYFGLRDSGKVADAQNVLRSITNENGSYGGGEFTIPYRARLLKRVNGNGTIPRTVPTLGSGSNYEPMAPEDLTLENFDTLAKLVSLSEPAGSNGERPRFSTVLNGLARAHDMIRAKQGQMAFLQLFDKANGANFCRGTGTYEAALRKLHQTLILQAIAQEYEAAAKPLPEESATVYIRRVLETQVAAGKWHDVSTALVVANCLDPREEYQRALTWYRILANGEKLETAEQYSAATQTYLDASRFANRLTSPNTIDARLKAIHAAHPKEYAEAVGPSR